MRLPIGRALTRHSETPAWTVPDEVEAPESWAIEVSEPELMEMLWLAEGWAQANELDFKDFD